MSAILPGAMQTRDLAFHELHLRRLGIAIELAEQGIAVPGGPIGEVGDEGLDLASAGVAKGWGSAIVSGIGLHEAGIELVLADQQAELVAEARLTVVVAVVPVRGRRVLIRSVRAGRPRRPAEFLDRAEADAVGLAEGAVDGAGLGDAHLGAVDKGRDIGRIGVPVADEASGSGETCRRMALKTQRFAAGSRQSSLNGCIDS